GSEGVAAEPALTRARSKGRSKSAVAQDEAVVTAGEHEEGMLQAEVLTDSADLHEGLDDHGEDRHEDHDDDDEADSARADDEDEESSDTDKPARAEDDFRSTLHTELAADTVQHYLNRISIKPLLSAPEELHFSTLARQGDFHARQTMIE